MPAIGEVLVAFDGSALSREALEHALEVYPAASITALHVIDHVEESYGAKALVGDETLRERARERSERLLAQAEQVAAEYDREVTTAAEVGRAAETILGFADEHAVDMIVLGSHGRSGVSRVVLGSVAEAVSRRAPVPVTIIR